MKSSCIVVPNTALSDARYLYYELGECLGPKKVTTQYHA